MAPTMRAQQDGSATATRKEPTRTGPRTDVDVRARAIEVAEELFGASGVDAVSVRQVARAVGVAPMAITHHFGDKDTLLEAVITRRGAQISTVARDRLSELVEQEATPTTRQLAEALMAPYLQLLNKEPSGGLSWLKILHSVGTANDPVWLRTLDRDSELVPSFVQVFDRVFPHCTPTQRSTLAAIAMYSMIGVLSGSDLSGFGTPLKKRGLDKKFVETLTTFLTAAFDGFAQ